MRVYQLFAAVLILSLAGSAQAAVKFYSSDKNNGSPSDSFLNSTTLCPPMRTTLGDTFGFAKLVDDATGTVTMETLVESGSILVDLGPDQLVVIFGPGAFIFIDVNSSTTTTVAQVSTTGGIGAHGPSSTAEGSTVEWGIVSSYVISGRTFCLSSPVAVCNNAGFAHGATTPRVLASDTYDLGTWNFDSDGYKAAQKHITRTSNGGLTNNGGFNRGAFVGASLPALPLIGFGVLALSLAVIGARTLLGKK